MNKKLVTFIKIGVFLGLGILLIWLSVRQLNPSTAKLANGDVLTTTTSQWSEGSQVELKKKDASEKIIAPDAEYILKDSSRMTVSNGKFISVTSNSSVVNTNEPALTDSDVYQIKKSLREGNYWWLGVSLLIGIFSHVVRAYRWSMLVQPMGYNPRFLNSFFAVMIGYVVNYGVPRLGEISRCTIINRYEKIPFTKTFGTVVAERVLDLIFFFIVFLIMIATQYSEISNYLQENVYPGLSEKWVKLKSNTQLLAILGGGTILFFGALFYFRKKIKGKFAEKIKGFIKGFSEGLSSVRKVKNPVYFIFLTALIWFSYYMTLFTCFKCLQESANLGMSEGITAFVFGSVTVMITPGGIGAYPYALQKVLKYIYNVPEAVGVSIGWLSWLSGFISTVSIGLLAFILLPIYNRNYEGSASAQVQEEAVPQ
jgi:glycosyltransferase 2 family protein